METILNILKKINPTVQINEATKLLEDGVLDSMSMVMFVSALCDEFDVEIPLRDVIPENFASPVYVNAYINRLLDEDDA